MKTLGQIVDAHSIRFERELPCSIDTAWDYLTQPGRLSTWLADGSIEPRVGGRVELNFDVEELPERAQGGDAIRGAVSLCVPRRVLAYTWMSPEQAAVETTGPTSTVTFALEPENSHTRLTLTHRHLPAEAIPRCAAGWHTHLEVLLARVQNRSPESFLEMWRRLLPIYEEKTGTKQKLSVQ
jgi:uncharacterized protein YndB with AHSA1/START domain